MSWVLEVVEEVAEVSWVSWVAEVAGLATWTYTFSEAAELATSFSEAAEAFFACFLFCFSSLVHPGHLSPAYKL